MIHWSIHTGSKTLAGRQHQTKPLSYQTLHFLSSIATSLLIYRLKFDWRICRYSIIFSASFLEKIGFTLNYNKNILQWIDHDNFFSNNMFIDINDKLCRCKEDNMFEWEIKDPWQICCSKIRYKIIWASWHQQSCYQPKTSEHKSTPHHTTSPG